MTKEKFRELCEHVLVPRLGDIFYRYFETVEEDIEIISRELIRMNKAIEAIANTLERTDVS